MLPEKIYSFRARQKMIDIIDLRDKSHANRREFYLNLKLAIVIEHMDSLLLLCRISVVVIGMVGN